jgi:hypothetical protein
MSMWKEWVRFAFRNERGIAMPQKQRYYSYGDQCVDGSLCSYTIHKSVKHFKNSQQIDYATDHGNSYADREKNLQVFDKDKPVHVVAMICC